MRKTIEKLKQLIKSKDKSLCLRRIQCVYFRLKKGWSSEEIAPLVGYCASYVREVNSDFEKNGFEIFKLEEKGGRKRENLSMEEESELLKSFEKLSGKGGILQISEVHKMYSETVMSKGKKEPAKSTTYHMLQRHGWRKVMPRPKHSKNDKRKMEDFKK